MKSFILWLFLFNGIMAQLFPTIITGVFNVNLRPGYTLLGFADIVNNIIANPQKLIYSLINVMDISVILNGIFTQLNNGQTPQWIINNQLYHNSLVEQESPKLMYDFIVVGAGTAGSIVASRLSENLNITVLLIEAGGAESLLTDTPVFFPFLARTKYDWAFVTEPQNNCFINMDDQRSRWQRGKVMGGSSSINGMVYVRGNPKDYDNWANITDDYSWSYSNVLKYFLKSEHNFDPEMLANGYHDDSGLYAVTSNWNTNPNPVSRHVLQAAKEFGINQIDLNGPQFVGCNVAQQAILYGNRITSSKAFLESVRHNRQNLDIIANAFVKRVIFAANKRAIGVVYDRLGHTFVTFADKEVILSAGSIKSPHILLTSGVGPKQQLNYFNIPLITDLPGVGENLQDHVNTIGIGYTVPDTGPKPLSISSFVQYARKREGPLAYLDNLQMPISSTVNDHTDWPDIQLNAITMSPDTDPSGIIFNNVYGLRLDVFNKMFYSHRSEPSFMFWGDLTRPRSRGKLELKSSDPYIYPKIQPNYLTHSYDIKVLVEANRWLFRFEYSKTFQNWTAIKFKAKVVGCESKWSVVNDTLYPYMLIPNDDYLECHARHMTSTPWHYVGTAKMGKASDPMAVVDTQLTVLGGITNLRVIDSSIMPVITDGNTNAPTMMIAEKGSQMIKDKYNL